MTAGNYCSAAEGTSFSLLARRPILAHLLAILVYTLLAIFVTSRILIDPAHSTFPSFNRDNFADFWNLWWVKECLITGQNPYYTRLLYYPTGTTLLYTEFGWFYGLLAAPFLALASSPFAPVVAHNLLVAITFLATGYAAFLFVRWESGCYWGALAMGAVFTLSPFRLHHVETMNLLSTFWIPLSAWLAGSACLKAGNQATDLTGGRAGRMPGLGKLVALGLCGAGLGATSYLMLAFTSIFLASWFAWTFFLDRDRFLPRASVNLPLTALAFILGAGAFVLPWIVAWCRRQVYQFPAGEWGLDLAGLLLPGRSALLGPLARSLGVHCHGPGGNELYIGIAVLGLVMVGIASGKRTAAPLALTGVLGLLLALGSRFWIAGKQVNLPVSPYEWLVSAVPLFGVSRTPERFALILMVALLPLAATGFRRLTGGRFGRLAATGVFLLCAVEVMPKPFAAQGVSLDPGYEVLKRAPGNGAVIEMPGNGISLHNTYMFHQTVHGKPLIGGSLARPSRRAYDFVQSRQFHNRLARQETLEGAIRELKELGVMCIVLHRGNMSADAWTRVVQAYQSAGRRFHESAEAAFFWIGEGADSAGASSDSLATMPRGSR